jgi:uncharacterized protein
MLSVGGADSARSGPIWAEATSILYAAAPWSETRAASRPVTLPGEPPMAESVAANHLIEPEIAALLAELKRRIERRCGDRFGSRARGDHDPDSDVDVAVILDQEMPRPFDITREILEDAYDLLLATGYYVQPWPLGKGSLDDPVAHPYPRISRAVRRERIRIE